MDRQWEVFPKRRSTRVNCSCTCVGLGTLGTDRVILLFDLSERNESDEGNHSVKITYSFFAKGFVGQLTDLTHCTKFTDNQ